MHTAVRTVRDRQMDGRTILTVRRADRLPAPFGLVGILGIKLVLVEIFFYNDGLNIPDPLDDSQAAQSRLFRNCHSMPMYDQYYRVA